MSDRPHVLVLEAEFLVASDLQDFLEGQGFTTTAFAMCERAEQWLAQNAPNVAILDVSLDGAPCLGIALALANRGIHFLVHSGWERGEGLNLVFANVPWLEKPAAYQAIMQCLDELLKAS